MPTRSRAREIAMQALYQLDLNPGTAPADIGRFLEGRLKARGLVAFARDLVDGVKRHLVEIDAALEAASDNWRVARMAAADRAILRLACHEILHADTPPKVACDEGVELAKRYGGASSPRFVAGILGRLLTDRSGQKQSVEDDKSKES